MTDREYEPPFFSRAVICAVNGVTTQSLGNAQNNLGFTQKSALAA